MKVLTSGEQLEGKKIVYCEIENTADIDTSMIITDDKSVLMFRLDYDKYTWHICTENQVKGKILISNTINKILLGYNVLTEDEAQQIKNELAQKNAERDKMIEKAEYQKYLKLKERYAHK